ncbi:hypothetical protein BRC97_05670 [Halobacteriales archaeon QS_6_71_20]|nr:MAG: hypothetical protein BRC97_05670 [Halobacteriales archaeon QS_6_71_20]
MSDAYDHCAVLSFPEPDRRRARAVHEAVRVEVGEIDDDRSTAAATRDGATVEVTVRARGRRDSRGGRRPVGRPGRDRGDAKATSPNRVRSRPFVVRIEGSLAHPRTARGSFHSSLASWARFARPRSQ